MDIIAIGISTVDASAYRAMLQLVSQEKQQQSQRYANYEDRLRSLLSEIIPRYVIAEMDLASLSSVRFERNAYGKPHAAGLAGFHYNISHSGEWVAGCFDTQPVGIDIEQVRPVDHHPLAVRYFHAEEREAYLNTPEKLRIHQFYETWTRKESVVKAVGKGLSLPLPSFSTIGSRVQAEGQILNLFSVDEAALYGYRLSVCAFSSAQPSRVRFLRADEAAARLLT